MKFYITTAIDYANSTPHVGTAYEKIGADVRARAHRLRGDRVWFLMGNDEHSTNVARRAREQGMDPPAYCDQMEQKFRDVWRRLDLSPDIFIRTSWPQHHRAVQEMFRRMREKGDIVRGVYRGLYCVSCEAYLRREDLTPEGLCPAHRAKPEWIEEENYFFLLSRYAARVREHIQRNPDFIAPSVRRNEILAFLDRGLEDISVSRTGTDWGVPVPGDESHRVYVWFDALINYITGVGFPDEPDRFAEWWPADVHVIGKDITRFHCVIWPAMLMSVDLPLPRRIHAHGWVHVRGQKMSKTLGTTIDPAAIAERFGADALRYFLLREIGFEEDGEFSWRKFAERYNADLANDLGNLVQRTLSMAHRYLGGILENAPEPSQAAPLRDLLLSLAPRVWADITEFRTHHALASIWEGVRRTNAFLEECAPWAKAKQGDRAGVAGILRAAAESIRIVSVLISPFLPSTVRAIRTQTNLPPAARWDEAETWSVLPPGHRVGEPKPIFPRVDIPSEED